MRRDIAGRRSPQGTAWWPEPRRVEAVAPLVARCWVGEASPARSARRSRRKAAVRLAVDTFGRLDVLVDDAGYRQFAPFEQMSAGDSRRSCPHAFTAWSHHARRSGDASAEGRSRLRCLRSVTTTRFPAMRPITRPVGGRRFQSLTGDGSRALRSKVCTLSLEVFGPTRQGAPFGVRRICCRSMRPPSVRS